MKINQSPCKRCKRVADPETCENKQCAPWRKWFLLRWSRIHAYGKQVMGK